MTYTQIIKLLIKIVTILPVVIEGIQSIKAKYEALNDSDRKVS